MNRNMQRWVMCVTMLALAATAPGLAGGNERRFGGSIDSYTATLDAAGPWHLDGEWSLKLNGDSGKGSFSVGLQMARANTEPRSAHTHHLAVTDGDVTVLPNGYRISGTAIITLNGNVAGFSGSPVDVEITGGNAVAFSNLSVTFGGAAANHFGTQAVAGVVTVEK